MKSFTLLLAFRWFALYLFTLYMCVKGSISEKYEHFTTGIWSDKQTNITVETLIFKLSIQMNIDKSSTDRHWISHNSQDVHFASLKHRQASQVLVEVCGVVAFLQ